MLHPVSRFRGFAVEAIDGEIGRVEDVYFEDRHWTVREVVVDTTGGLGRPHVLVPSTVFRAIDWSARRVVAGLSGDAIRRSPDVGVGQPISRRDEHAILQHYGLPTDGVDRPPARGAAAPVQPAAPDELFLRSAHRTTGHTIQARDGDIGHVDDYLLDEEARRLRYVVVATRNWWPGKKVLLSLEWIEELCWPETTMQVDVTREAIRRAPEYDPARPMDPETERRLHEAHGRQRPLTADERAAHRSQVAGDQLGIPRASETPPIESDAHIRQHVWGDKRPPSRD